MLDRSELDATQDSQQEWSIIDEHNINGKDNLPTLILDFWRHVDYVCDDAAWLMPGHVPFKRPNVRFEDFIGVPDIDGCNGAIGDHLSISHCEEIMAG